MARPRLKVQDFVEKVMVKELSEGKLFDTRDILEKKADIDCTTAMFTREIVESEDAAYQEIADLRFVG